jgi:DNA-binding NarL/FixJ family response regulator
MSTITISVVDNDPVRLEKHVAAFGLQPDLKVVSAVSKRETAVKQLSLAPDIMLLNADVLKQRTLSRFLRSIQAKSPSTRILLLHPERPEDDVLIDEIRMGVRGYVRPADPPALVAKAIRTVAGGEIWAERRVLEKTISRHLLLPETLRNHVPDLQPLTGREMDMLNMVMKGASNREIAEMSNISERTVKTHLYRVYRKLKVKSRAKAIALLSHS